ncbi:MAG: phasin family protein [Rhizobiales bacterium]|nr:phasin family protein [Hyphomicrobiales bacterium]
MKNVMEDFQKISKDNMDAVLANMGVVSKTLQTIASETADYSKKSLEDSSAAVEKMMAVKSLDKAFEVQTEYAKSAYEGFVGQATKIGEMYTSLAKEVYKPFEQAVAKATK